MTINERAKCSVRLGAAEGTFNTKLNDLRKKFWLRKSEVTVERISVCNVFENLAEHGIYYLPCSVTKYVTDMLA